MNPIEPFKAEVAANIAGLKSDTGLPGCSRICMRQITRHKYTCSFISITGTPDGYLRCIED
jgi:hypothetical protein